MNKLFVPYELALLAKEKGFNNPCLALYSKFGVYENQEQPIYKQIPNQKEAKEYFGGVTAPLYQQLVDWFREKHEIHIYITPSYFGEDSLEKHPGYGYNIKRLFIKFRGRYTSTSKYSFKEINDKLIDINGMLLKGSDNYLNTLSIALENAFKLI